MDIKLFLESVFSSKLRKIIKYLKENTVIDLTDILKEMPWDKIKKYINPNVTKLIVPFGVSVRRDMSFFNNFSHLESIDFKNGFIQNDDLDILSQGSVKQIEAEDGLIDISKSENAASISYNDKSKFYYNGVLISLNGHNRFGSRDTINVEMSNFDKDILKLLLEDVNTLEFNKIILCGINPSTSLIHNIEYSGKVIKDIQSSTRNDGQDLLDFYKLLIDNGYTFENVQMAITNLDFEINSKEFLKEALSLFEKTNVSRLSVKSIETTKNDPSLILKNNVLENLIIPISKKSDLEEFYNFLENKGLKVSELTLRLDMYDKYSDDEFYEYLRQISKSVNLNICYGKLASWKSSFEEFAGLRESIKWYRSLIAENDLSPVEKLMYGYDLVKSFQYKDNGEGEIGRAPHLLISSDYIVCAGYCNLLEEIINGVDSGLSLHDDSLRNANHARIMARVDDDKYNIHGLFALDPTFDSTRTINGIDRGIDLYEHFMIPPKDYFRVFGSELPYLFEHICNGDFNFQVKSNLKKLFCKEVDSVTVLKYIQSASRLDNIQFKEILKNVRMAEGYTEEEAMKEVDKIFNSGYRPISDGEWNVIYNNYLEELEKTRGK